MQAVLRRQNLKGREERSTEGRRNQHKWSEGEQVLSYLQKKGNGEGKEKEKRVCASGEKTS